MALEPSARWLGAHRVIIPSGALPQAAIRLDSRTPLQSEEMQISVSDLHVDAFSFRQILEAEDQDPSRIKRHIAELVADRGKLHNPVTGSGGMLIGKVDDVGGLFPNPPKLGASIASLVSLTLTPLNLDAIHSIDLASGRIEVSGAAFLFGDCPWCLLPDDLPPAVALAALDVAGAAPRTRLRTKRGDRIIVLGGGGRSGLLASLAARQAGAASVVAVDLNPQALARARELGAADEFIACDARDALALVKAVGKPADLTVSCVDVADAEPGAILATKPDGRVLFFSMATRFPAACLAAEGFGRPVTLEMGNGFVAGHADETLALVRLHPQLQFWLMQA